MSEKKIPEIPPRIIKSHKAWSRDTFLLRVVYAGLTISAIVFSIIVAAEITLLEPIYITIFAIISAISTGLLSAFDIPSKSNRVRDFIVRNPA